MPLVPFYNANDEVACGDAFRPLRSMELAHLRYGGQRTNILNMTIIVVGKLYT